MIALRLLVTLLLLAFTSALTSEGDIAQSTHISLGFGPCQGVDVTDSEVTNFINFVNSASSFFKDDILKRHAYIREQMNRLYGKPGYDFSIFENWQHSFDDFNVSQAEGHYACLKSGYDRIFILTTYMFARQPTSNNVFLTFTRVGDRGAGMTQMLETAVNNAVLSAEADQFYCLCSFNNAEKISNKMNKYDGGQWSVFCSYYSMMSGSASAYNQIGIYTMPNYCYYILYKTS